MENTINEFDVVKRVLFGDLPESDPQFRQWLESSNANLLLFLELKGEVECAVSDGFDKKRSFEDISEILGLNKKWYLFQKNKLWMVPLFVAAALTLFWGLFRTFVVTDKDAVAQMTATSLPDAVNTAYLVSPGCDGPIYLQDRFTVKLRDGSTVMNEENCLSFTDTGNLSGVPGNQTLFVPRGTDYSLTLSDGTRVKLNSDSEISFPSRFSGQERRVRIQGEAYFEVTKSETPFIVETDEMEVEVLGTIFNINSYSASPCCMATLVKGSVKVRSESIEGGLVLRPSENLVLRASEHKERRPGLPRGRRLFGEAARPAAVLCDEPADAVLPDGGDIHFPGKGALHGDDVPVRDAKGLAGADRLRARQHAGIEPPRVELPERAEFFCSGGEKDVPLPGLKPVRRLCRVFEDHGVARLALFPLEAQVLDPGLGAGFAHRLRHMGRVGMRRVHAEGRAL